MEHCQLENGVRRELSDITNGEAVAYLTLFASDIIFIIYDATVEQIRGVMLKRFPEDRFEILSRSDGTKHMVHVYTQHLVNYYS